MTNEESIRQGKTTLGIEFGSTRIKAVLIDFEGNVLGIGVYDWENALENNIWTYSFEKIHTGLRRCYSSLRDSIEQKYDVKLEKTGAIGISAMMHGYMAFDEKMEPLTIFQTWRNSNTQKAADELTQTFDFNIPLRWSVAHFYQRILDKEEHVKRVKFISTLAVYIHYKLTGNFVAGIGDASGMFPIDSKKGNYDEQMVHKFDELISSRGITISILDILPKIVKAGEYAGHLTEEGAAFLDEKGYLKAGIPLCAPEGDAGTGMVATNAVEPGTGNVSAGTSIFAMVVLKNELSKIHREIDMVTTPEGYPCAMVHVNNGTSDLNAWVKLFSEFAELIGQKISTGELYKTLYEKSLTGDLECGGLLSYGYYSGENITRINQGRPMFLRMPNSNFNLSNFMRVHLFSTLGALKLGLDILAEEKVEVEHLNGHGGLFKTPEVGQRYLSAAAGVPVTIMHTASEGGAWGIALLALYLINAKDNETLGDYLNNRIFKDKLKTTIMASEEEQHGFLTFMKRYKQGLLIEETATHSMNW